MPGVDSAVPWHYGDPLREQRVLRTGAGVVDRSNRDVLQVTGEDRLDWLHTICSQHLTNLVDGRGLVAGRIVHLDPTGVDTRIRLRWRVNLVRHGLPMSQHGEAETQAGSADRSNQLHESSRQ